MAHIFQISGLSKFYHQSVLALIDPAFKGGPESNEGSFMVGPRENFGTLDSLLDTWRWGSRIQTPF